MTDTEFQAYLAEDIQRYADEQIRAGNWDPEEALEKSRSEHQQLLPEGLASKNHYLFSIIDAPTSSRVGIIWLSVNLERPRRSAFLYDFLIFDEFRRKCYGSQALEALEENARALGIETISLHVFSHNSAAQALYQKQGYQVTGIYMSKQLVTPIQ